MAQHTDTRTRAKSDAGQWCLLVLFAFVAFAPQAIVGALVLAAARLLCLAGAGACLWWLFKADR